MKMKTISKELCNGGQDLLFTEVLRISGDVEVMYNVRRKLSAALRISIRSDCYRDQCFARIERWDGDRWQELHTVHDMHTLPKLAYRTDFGEFCFKHDRDELLRVALEVLVA